MKRFFENSKSFWVRYSDYVVREDDNGVKHLQAGDGAVPELYDPTRNTKRRWKTIYTTHR